MAGVSYTNWTENLRKPWLGEPLSPARLVPGGARLDASQFRVEDAVVVTTSGASAGATTVPVTALSGPIPSGTILRFGVDEFARLTANAAAGATSLTVDALVSALEASDVAVYGGAGVKKKLVPGGTFVGRTRVERDAGTGFGPWASGDEEVFLLAHDIHDADVNPDATLIRHRTLIKENLLPNWTTIGSSAQAAIRAAYDCIVGIN